MKDFISFLAGAIFIEELLADDNPPPVAPTGAPNEERPPVIDTGDDRDEQ